MAGPALTDLGDVKLQELQHFAELGRLSASLLHEISNPLTVALLELDHPDNQHQSSVRQARHNLQIIRRYVEAARQQVHGQSLLRCFALQGQLEQLKRVLKPLARAAKVDLQFEPIPRCQLYGDPVKFQQIIANLVTNAIDAYRNDQYPDLDRTVRICFQITARTLTIKVIDWGEGITSKHLPLVFEPFFSTKQNPGHGLGIGLYIVKQYVTREFSGSLTVASSRRAGTRFTLKLPLA